MFAAIGERPELLGWALKHLATDRLVSVAYPGIFFGEGGCSTNSVEDRENRDLEAVAPLVRGYGGSCNLVQEISFHIVKFSFTTNCLAVAYLFSELKPTPASRKFDRIKPECKLSGKCLVFHSNILISLKIAEFRTPTPQGVRKKGQ